MSSPEFTVFGGSLSEAHAEKMVKIQDMALQNRAPIIGLFDAGGARIQEGVAALGGYGEVFTRNVLECGRDPADLGDHGPCAGGDALIRPPSTDFIFMVVTPPTCRHGPDVVKTGDQGGGHRWSSFGAAPLHTAKSSIADGAYENDVETLLQMRRPMDFLPSNNQRRLAADARTPGTVSNIRSRHADPRQSEQALRHQGLILRSWTRATSSR
jgi:propionyl-CoA carboxylase beta chain